MKRREIIKRLGILPVAGTAMVSESFGASLGSAGTFTTKPPARGKNIYESLGVETIINCRGTFTILGGSTERPEVLKAMEAASGYFVQYDELANGIGSRLAELTKAEWGIVTAGCAAAMKHATAACVTGGNPEKLIRIPHIDDLEKNEVIIPRSSRNVYDQAIRNVGVKIIMVDTPEELEQAINPRTAMIYIMTGRDNETGKPLSLEVISGIAKPRKIPILADAAAEDLSIPSVHLERGANMVAYSGGKAICGPQCAGLLLGDKDLLMAAWQASSPHHGPGRDNKIGKEEMLGMLAAVEAWTTRDHDKEWETWIGWLDEISSRLTKIDGITSDVQIPTGLNNRAPRLTLKWDPDKLHITGEEVAEEVGRNKPRIAIGGRSTEDDTSISINPSQMRPGNAKLVADRLYGVLSEKREPRSDEMALAIENATGHWEAEVDFFTSKSIHKFFLEHEGNWISGTHTSEFSMQELTGMIEGKEMVLRSRYSVPGNSIDFWFIGEMAKGEISGSVFLGEYLTAKFSAKKVSYDHNHRKLMVPGGPPLAT